MQQSQLAVRAAACALAACVAALSLSSGTRAQAAKGGADPCLIECPPGAVLESEACRFGDADPVDDVNGGCGSFPPIYSELVCGVTYCGNGYFDGLYRDTDWWELDDTGNPVPMMYHLEGVAEFNALFGRIDNAFGEWGCDEITGLAQYEFAPKCETAVIETGPVESGRLWYWVGADFSEIVDCNQPAGGPPNEPGARYLIEVTCTPMTPCPGDVDGSGAVGFSDLVEILSNWGDCPAPCAWDLDGDGQVGFSDLVEVLSHWGPCPP